MVHKSQKPMLASEFCGMRFDTPVVLLSDPVVSVLAKNTHGSGVLAIGMRVLCA